MSEPLEQEIPEIPDKQPIMTLYITKDGKLEITGMLADKVMALGILELAKIQLQEHWKAQELKLHKPDNRLMAYLRNGKK